MQVAWRENLRTALVALRAHKLRSGLTMLGVVIGVLSVISVAAIIHGLNQHIADRVKEIGAKTLFVTRFPAFTFEQWPEKIRLRKHFTYDDVRALREQCPSCALVSPFYTRALFFGQRNEVRFRNQKVDNPFVRGAEPDMPKTVPVFVVKEGRMFSVYEDAHSEQVCVLGLAIADSLFGRLDPVGQTVRINGREFRVVGVWEKHEGLLGGPGVDQFIIIPYNTFHKLWPEIEELIIAVAADDPRQLARARDEITEVLRRRRRVAPGAESDFEVTSPDFVTDLWKQLTGAIVLLTFIISSIGLVVGGIGVMNIMLVSVTERTAEIGLRKAMGARRRDIRRQFLTEAVMLTALGGGLGILLGALATLLTRWAFPSLPTSLSWFWVAMGFAMSVGVGLFFGIYPAARAAGLDPVACLRYE
ncbi:MAG: ABC transporter permease [Acidobacteria bacterium]|nr:ABC transporter permease [Acidobacteriota bacterium]